MRLETLFQTASSHHSMGELLMPVSMSLTYFLNENVSYWKRFDFCPFQVEKKKADVQKVQHFVIKIFN